MRGAFIISVVFSSTAIAVGVSQYAFGLFIVPIEETFGWTRTEISASLSFAAVGGLSAPLLGRAMDRFGARPVLVISLVVFGLSFCLRPLMTELWHWYALSFMQFVTFSGMTVLPAGRLVAAWFPRIRGRMTGIAGTGNNVGGLVMPVFIAALLVAMPWSDASVVIGVASFVIAGAAALVIREAPPAAGVQAHRPLAADERAAPSAPTLHDRDLRETVRTRSFYAVLAAITLGTFTYSAILPHMLAHLVNKGMANASALSALAHARRRRCLRQAPVRVDVGTLRRTAHADVESGRAGGVHRAPRRRRQHRGARGRQRRCSACSWAGFGALYILVVQESFGMRHYGSVMGLMNLGTVVSFGLGPLVAGASYDISGGYGTAFLIVCGLFVAGALSLIFARPRIQEASTAPPRSS